MGLFMEDASRTYGGENTNISSRVSPLLSYSTNVFPKFVTFKSFRCDIKPEGFGCNPFDGYLSFEEEVLLKNK